jgi:hypothetical protein
MPEDDEKDQQIARLNNDVVELRRKLKASESRTAALEVNEGNHEAALLTARSDGAKEARAQFDKEHVAALAAAELRVLATGRMVNPADVALFIPVESVLKDNKFDPDAAAAALEKLQSERAYAFVSTAPPPPPLVPGKTGNGNRPPGSADQGPRPLGGVDPDTIINDALKAAVHRK